MFIYSFAIIVSLIIYYLNIPNWNNLNLTLLMIFFISLVECCKQVGNKLSLIQLDALDSLKTNEQRLANYAKELDKHAEDITKLQLNSLFILLTDAYNRNDNKMFEQIINKFKELHIPESALKNQKTLSNYLDKINNNEIKIILPDRKD